MKTLIFLRLRRNTAALAIAGILTSTLSHAQVNSWINPNSGKWEDTASWSLGVSPGGSQSVMITNLLWKAVTIDSATVSSSPQSLTVNSLTLISRTNSVITSKNTLLLNYAAAGNPLVIGVDTNTPGSLLVDSSSAVTMFSSGLIVNNALGTNNSHLGEFEVDGTFIQSDNSEVVAGFLDLTGTYSLTNGELFVGTQFINGRFNQQGGRNLGSVDMETTNGDYELFDGLVQGDVMLRAGTFNQHGGTNTAKLVTGFRGVYNLSGGMLMPGDLVVGSPPQNFLEFAGGGIEQTGGTNSAGNISTVFGFYNLRGGKLAATRLALTNDTLLGGAYAGHFDQYGGYHTNGGTTMTGTTNSFGNIVTAVYTLNVGILETPFITMNRAGFNHNAGTNRVGTLSMTNVSGYVINSGLLDVGQIRLSGGSFSDNGGVMAGTRNVTLADGTYWYEWHTAAQLGQLQISSGTNSFLYLLGNPCVLQFADSSGVPWASGGRLIVPNWSGSLTGGGSQQLFFGTGASGLTAQQISQVQFVNPVGLPGGTYSARILSGGEIVPDLGSSNSGLLNAWTNPGSGNWDQSSNWSLGVLPGSPQTVLIINTNWKAVAINPSTPINFPASMTVSNLFIRGATNTENSLLLNSFGTAVPLTVLNGLTLQDGAQILNFNSGLDVRGGTFMVTNSDIIQDGGFVRATNAPMYLSGSEYNLTNGVFEGGSVSIGYPVSARFNQYGGTAIITNLGLGSFISGTIPNGISLYGGTLNLPGGMSLIGEAGGVSYFQTGGTNWTTQVTIEPDYAGATPSFTLNGGLLADSGMSIIGGPTINQNGGTHMVTNGLYLEGESVHGMYVIPATYILNGGTLSARGIELNGNNGDSIFVQSNGTTRTETFFAHSVGYFGSFVVGVTLGGGSLSCSNFTLDDGRGGFNQSGGALVVSNLLTITGYRDLNIRYYGRYTFSGGTLVAGNINITGDWIIGDSTGTNRISNTGMCSLSHTLQIGNAVEQLGRFIVASNATIDLAGSASKLSFANSSAESWTGGAILSIANWNGALNGGGSEQLKFGNNATGLTAGQLGQIQFINPAGLPAGTYAAQILSTGEVVPTSASGPTVILTSQGNNIVLTWPDGWALQTSTNAAGPFEDLPEATSPYTNSMSNDPQRFFRVRN